MEGTGLHVHDAVLSVDRHPKNDGSDEDGEEADDCQPHPGRQVVARSELVVIHGLSVPGGVAPPSA